MDTRYVIMVTTCNRWNCSSFTTPPIERPSELLSIIANVDAWIAEEARLVRESGVDKDVTVLVLEFVTGTTVYQTGYTTSPDPDGDGMVLLVVEDAHPEARMSA